jgi:hypothetical protein
MAFDQLKIAFRALAGVCDYAVEKDWQGFNAPDAKFGHVLVYTKKWQYTWAIKAHDILRKYKDTQLKGFGINYDEIPIPKKGESDFLADNGLETAYLENLTEYLNEIEWETEPKEIKLNGESWKVVFGRIPLGFWEAWKTNKLEIRKMGIEAIYWIDGHKLIKKLEKLTKPCTYETLRSLTSWSSPEYNTQIKKWVRHTPNLPDGFWDLRNADKDRFYNEGFGIKPRDGVWTLTQFTLKDPTIPDIPEDPKIEEEKKEKKKEEEIKIKKEEEEKQIIIEKITQSQDITKDFDFTPLFDYQIEQTKNLMKGLTLFGAMLDGSSTGTGKTVCSLITAKLLGKKPLIICPRNALYSWRRWLKQIGIEFLAVVNYESIKIGKMPKYRQSKRKVRGRYTEIKELVPCPFIKVSPNESKDKWASKWIISWVLPRDVLLVFDEGHRCNNPRTINSQLMVSACDQHIKMLILSATIGETPLKMYGISRALGFWEKPWEFYTNFCMTHDCRKNDYGWEYVGGRWTMKILHDEIYGAGKGSRMDKEILVKQGKFPETQIIAEAYDMGENTGKITAEYELMLEELAKMSYIPVKKETVLQLMSNSSVDALVIRQKARMKIELLKVPVITEMTNDLIDSGYSVAIFVNYTGTLLALMKSLDSQCVIYGENTSNPQRANELCRVEFQENRSRVIICNVSASKECIDLHDVKHEYQRVSIIIPDDNAQSIKQVLGRLQRAGGTMSQQRIFFAADTIEEEVCENVRRKCQNIDTLNEGEVNIASYW